MDKILSINIFKLIVLNLFIIIAITTKAETSWKHEYKDFSSDRSTFFFNIERENGDTVFFDFFSPFDPTVKTKIYDPLVSYKLENNYYINENNQLMINLEDLRKLYAPYFDYQIDGDDLSIQYTLFEKSVLSGFNRRSTSLEYTKKTWKLNMSISNNKNAIINYKQYESVKGSRNKPAKFTGNIIENSSMNISFNNKIVDMINKKYYISIADLMKHMGKDVFITKGYLHVQTKNLTDVTTEVKREEYPNIARPLIPNANNSWHSGSLENSDENYTWADYMNDILDNKRDSGWIWRAFYIPSGKHFVDKNGNESTLDADRIIAFNIYVPTNHNAETRLLMMLHGGTGNENTPTYRLILRDMPIDEYLEKYNYILVSPNGWTQNPMWREGQALYSFMKAYEMTVNKYNIDKNRVFITGNSMGGKGTIEIAMRYPYIFQAMAPTAMKITDIKRDKSRTKIINIHGTRYSLDSVKDMPTFIAQGTTDSTTSFKTQIGNKVKAGSVVKAVIPKLNNAIYLSVEQGSHSYAYGSVLPAMFDFFEDSFEEKDKTELDLIHQFDKTEMVSLAELQMIFGKSFKFYEVSAYNKSPDKTVNYYTVLFNGNSLNFSTDSNIYRVNMNRYKEDANILGKEKTLDTEYLESAPRFSLTPYEESGYIFVPAREFMSNFR